MLIEIYADGSATIAAKPGGYGWVLVADGIKMSEGNGHIHRATNNDAEMEAAIQGMAAVIRFIMTLPPETKTEVHLRCDSQIVLNWANGTSAFKQTAKMRKYEQLRALFLRLKAKDKWVRGHSGHEHNERCDVLATLGRLNLGIDADLPKKPKKRAKKIDKESKQLICLSFKNVLKIIDFENNLVEDYSPKKHGERVAMFDVNLGE